MFIGNLFRVPGLKAMRFIPCAVAALICLESWAAVATSRPASPDELALLKQAVENGRQESERWAYTETTITHTNRGRPRGETIVRFDPSKPYAEQFTPLKVDGKEPTDRQRASYRKQGEKRGDRLMKSLEQEQDPGRRRPQLRVGGDSFSVDLEHPAVHEQTGERIVFELPVVGDGRQKEVPADKFQVLVRVNRAGRSVENIRILLRESFRVKVVAKLKKVGVSIDFTTVDPRYGPLMTDMSGDFAASLMFLSVDGTFTRTRTDWQRVKPFDERFQVKVGPLENLDF